MNTENSGAKEVKDITPKAIDSDIGPKAQLVLNSLEVFLDKNKRFRDILMYYCKSNKKTVSLRMLDWFATNYSKDKNVVLYSNDQILNVHENYKAQLLSYGKGLFDPFRRQHKVSLKKGVVTSIGMMNFFRWLLTHGLLEFVEMHRKEIEEHMRTCMVKPMTRKRGRSRALCYTPPSALKARPPKRDRAVETRLA